MMMNNKHVNILGINFISITMERFVDLIVKRIEEETKTFIVTANPEIVMYAQRDSNYKKLLKEANFVVPDGIGIVKAAKLLNLSLHERIPGFDLMMNLLKAANKHNKKVYMLGGQKEVLLGAEKSIRNRYPNVEIVGSHHGYFNWEDPSVINDIIKTRPDLVFVALGFPKQEKWIHEHIDKVEKGIFIGVGGSFDVLAGKVKRAPFLWQKLNLEWLYRLIQQPSRWKRMLVLPQFALKIIILKQKR